MAPDGGHFLDSKNFTVPLSYFWHVSLPSLRSARNDSTEDHLKQSYEIRATKLAISFFGPRSLIATKRILYIKHLNDK